MSHTAQCTSYFKEAREVCHAAINAAVKHDRSIEWSHYLFLYIIIESFLAVSSEKNSFKPQDISALTMFIDDQFKSINMARSVSALSTAYIKQWMDGLKNSDTKSLAECVSSPFIRELPVSDVSIAHEMNNTLIPLLQR